MVGRTLLAYALPAAAFAVPLLPVFVFLPAFYAEDLGLGLAAVGGALALARVLDVVSDPLVGLLSDRLGGRFGRRKPLIAFGGVLCGGALLALFLPPAQAGVGWLAVGAIILYLGWTLVQVPYTAWGAELTSDYHGRARVTGARETAALLGVLGAGAVPPLVAALGGTRADALGALAVAAVVLGAPAVAWMLWRVPREPVAGGRGPRGGGWRSMAANRPFRLLLAAWIINGLATGLPAVLFPLYVEYGLGGGQTAQGAMVFLYFAAAVAAIPLWLRLSRRIGKHRTWCVAMLGAVAAFAWVPLLGPGDLGVFAVVCLVTGAALGADLSLPPALQGDVIDLDRLKTGRERAGIYFALWSMATKLPLALAVGVAFPVLAMLGFDPGVGAVTAAGLSALAMIYAWVPSVLKLAAVAIVWRYPLTERRHAAVLRRLARRTAMGGPS